VTVPAADSGDGAEVLVTESVSARQGEFAEFDVWTANADRMWIPNSGEGRLGVNRSLRARRISYECLVGAPARILYTVLRGGCDCDAVHWSGLARRVASGPERHDPGPLALTPSRALR